MCHREFMARLHGLHHITAISGPAPENVDFYAGVLGMRLVKRSVNQDDPTTYHLFYADAEGHPGTDLTFFPWAHLAPPRLGHGLAVEVSLEVPRGTLDYWAERLSQRGVQSGAVETRFTDRALPLVDPHGMQVALVESGEIVDRKFSPWADSPVPPECQIRGLYGARIPERDPATTVSFLQDVLGFTVLGNEGDWTRYGCADAAGHVDICQAPPSMRRGAWGVGSVHHLAWRVVDDAEQRDMRAVVAASGVAPTPVIDRFWFKSVYFQEPGGVLFEIATDGPGFGIDEDPAHLGESLVLPPFLEPHRAAIERALPPIAVAPLRVL
jgi:glyoxalase family protein